MIGRVEAMLFAAALPTLGCHLLLPFFRGDNRSPEAADANPLKTDITTRDLTKPDAPEPPISDRGASVMCSVDDTTAVPATGQVPTGPAADFVPLCSGMVLLGDSQANKVALLSITGAKVPGGYALTASPSVLALDATHNRLFAGLSASATLARIDLTSGKVDAIALDASVVSLALGNGSQVFATLDDKKTWPKRGVAVVDGTAGTVEKTVVGDFAPLIAYDLANDKLIAAAEGLSPSSLSRYVFQKSSLTITLEESLWNAGSNGQDLALSPNGKQVAFSCGGGNGSGYKIADYASANLNSPPAGQWDTGPYPRSAAFSPDGKLLVASNGSDLSVFDSATHAKLKSWPISVCTYGEIDRVGFSRGGRIVYGLTYCGFEKTSSTLHWARYDP